MRKYLLTELERIAVKKYLKDGVPNDFIHVIRHRARKYLPIFNSDIELLDKLVEDKEKKV